MLFSQRRKINKYHQSAVPNLWHSTLFIQPVTNNIMGNRLYIFNPETDILLGINAERAITLSKHVDEFRRKRLLLPAIYAHPESFLLIDDDSDPESLPYYDIAHGKRIQFLRKKDLARWDGEIIPWGWNMALANFLMEYGVSVEAIPSAGELKLLRTLSHRGNSILFHNMLKKILPDDITIVPEELTDVASAVRCAEKWRGAYFKSPWSSSGRGVFRTGKKLSTSEITRIQSVIKSQGSIMAEYPAVRTLDFASEWILLDGKATFQGFSVFNTSPSGKYISNVLKPQSKLKDHISNFTKKGDIDHILPAQRQAIETIYGNGYCGPVGVDMLVDDRKVVNPCVEVNLRMTMGHTAIHAHKNFPGKESFTP